MLENIYLRIKKTTTGILKQKRYETYRIQKKIAYVNPTMSIIILNVNELNNPIKHQRSSDLINKQDPPICC